MCILFSPLPAAEDQYGVLAQYYGLPWLSYRNAVWHGLMQDLPGYRRYEMFPAEDERHPTALGHKYMADIAVNLVQQTYVDSLLVPMDVQLLEGHPLAKVGHCVCCAVCLCALSSGKGLTSRKEK